MRHESVQIDTEIELIDGIFRSFNPAHYFNKTISILFHFLQLSLDQSLVFFR